MEEHNPSMSQQEMRKRFGDAAWIRQHVGAPLLATIAEAIGVKEDELRQKIVDHHSAGKRNDDDPHTKAITAGNEDDVGNESKRDDNDPYTKAIATFGEIVGAATPEEAERILHGVITGTIDMNVARFIRAKSYAYWKHLRNNQ